VELPDQGPEALTGLSLQLRLDDLMGELQGRLTTIQVTPDRVQGLLDAVLAVGSDLDLQTVLYRIVQAASRLVEAKYGALGVIGDNDTLSQFLTIGIDDAAAADIGPLPSGHGLLGVLITDPRTLRLDDLSQHPSSFGFPAKHPPMRTFLGVPIRIRDEVFGNLYLTEKANGAVFDEEDANVVRALATAAGVAIENARLYDSVRRRERWLTASSEITTALLSGLETEDVLNLVVARARELGDADFAAIALPLGEDLIIEIAEGSNADDMAGKRLQINDTLAGECFRSGRSICVEDVRDDARAGAELARRSGFGPALYVPLRVGATTRAILIIANLVGGAVLASPEQELFGAFAGQAALGLELARQRSVNDRLSVFRDRDRIARDLHDLVIQRLFAIGMHLESSMRFMTNPEAGQLVQNAVEDLDKTIKEIRSTIYALTRNDRTQSSSLRARVVAATEEAGGALGFVPALRLEGLVDTKVPPEVGENVLAVLHEALSNAARHAHASHVAACVAVEEHKVIVVIEDDGKGIPPGVGRRSGLANLEARAATLGGGCSITNRVDGGTEVRWWAPLGDL
jgi:signal transduction histidine kinase